MAPLTSATAAPSVLPIGAVVQPGSTVNIGAVNPQQLLMPALDVETVGSGLITVNNPLGQVGTSGGSVSVGNSTNPNDGLAMGSTIHIDQGKSAIPVVVSYSVPGGKLSDLGNFTAVPIPGHPGEFQAVDQNGKAIPHLYIQSEDLKQGTTRDGKQTITPAVLSADGKTRILRDTNFYATISEAKDGNPHIKDINGQPIRQSDGTSTITVTPDCPPEQKPPVTNGQPEKPKPVITTVFQPKPDVTTRTPLKPIETVKETTNSSAGTVSVNTDGAWARTNNTPPTSPTPPAPPTPPTPPQFSFNVPQNEPGRTPQPIIPLE